MSPIFCHKNLQCSLSPADREKIKHTLLSRGIGEAVCVSMTRVMR